MKITDCLRFFWRKYLIAYRASWLFIIIFLTLLVFPFLILLALFARNKGGGYCVGIQELCGNVSFAAESLKMKGYANVSSLAIVGAFDESNTYDYRVSIPKFIQKLNNVKLIFLYFITFPYLIRFLISKKYFIFYWNRSFFPLNLDFFLLKIAKKKVVIFHCGDDVRYRPIHNRLLEMEHLVYSFPDLEDTTPNITFLEKFYYQKFPLLLNIPIYTLMDQETFLDRPVHQFRVPQITNLEPALKKRDDIPIIVHAPSHRKLKGTDIILEAVHQLHAERYNFKFFLLENLVNTEVIKILERADIVIDQPGLWGGRLAMEGMAHSCIVLGGNNPRYEKGSIKLPIIEFKRDKDDLYKKLRSILEKEDLESLRPAFYECYKDFYSADAFVNHLIGVFEGTIEPDLFPHENHKQKLLEAAENSFQRLIIKLFIKD